jgi:hypothetical protein
MSNNIWGYQGLQTPLENLTKGDYNVADYTNMRKEFNARLQALENQGGFIPTNVSIQGYCNIVPGSNGFGNFSATGSTILGGTLSVASTATFLSGVSVAGALSVSNINISNFTANSATVSGDITSTGGKFVGNGNTLSLIGFVRYDQTLNQAINPTANTSKHFNIVLNYQNNCSVSLSNQFPTIANFPDQCRYVTITKKGLASGAFTVTLTLPVQAGYTWFWATPESDLGTGAISMGTTIFSYTFLLVTNNLNQGICYLVNKVTV